MKTMNFIQKGLMVVAVAALTLIGIGLVKSVSAASCVDFKPGLKIKEPIFNNFCNSEQVGNETDFVRIRQSSNGNNMDNQNNPLYTGGTLNAACNTGDKYDIWTYIHNNADEEHNKNGTGSGVAHNVKLALSAPGLNTTNSSFSFSSTVSASNAASVTDSTGLKCGGNVKLTLVASTVHQYSKPYGWKNLSDGSVNSTIPLGSPNFGSGDHWGCWDYRTIVVYTVTVEKPIVTPDYACKLLTLDILPGRKVNANVQYTATGGATFKSATFSWGDNTANTTVNGTSASHTYAADGNYTVNATLKFDIGGTEKEAVCSKPLSFTTPPTTPTPTVLPNTGPGAAAALFAGVASFAGMFHYLWSGRKPENL